MPDEETGLVAGTGIQAFTAANGDKLTTTFAGLLDPTTGEATITGGTGRFADAEESFVSQI